MGIRERKQAVHDVLAAYAASDADALRTVLTNDVVWWVPPSAAGRYPRPISGIDAVLEVLAGPSRSYRKPSIRWTIHHIVGDEGDIVMANASMTADLINGNPYANDYCYVFRFEGDRIAEGTEYADTAHAMQLASAPPAS
jgi:uncharacterized protein